MPFKIQHLKMKKLLTLIFIAAAAISCSDERIVENLLLGGTTPLVNIYSYNAEDNTMEHTASKFRGEGIEVVTSHAKEIDDKRYLPIITPESKEEFYILSSSAVATQEEVVQEKSIFVRTPASIIGNIETSKVATLANKGEELTIIGFDTVNEQGVVNRYKVSHNNTEGWIYGKYLHHSKEEALKSYKGGKYDKIHKAVRNPFGGGKASGCDYHPVERVTFENNVMPEACYSIYLNCGVIGNIEQYIAFAKRTKINTFVIDIKDNGCPGYKSEAMQKYSPTNYQKAPSAGEANYLKAVKRLKEEGFYVVGRITCFKDSYFVKDHPECAITSKSNGQPYKHNKAYWPSPYDRKVWQFNVELAKESVRKFGFNEINFDYVRFPDRMTKIENIINYHNKYNESKVQAIQRFVQYACDEIHAVGAYVSIDVFGECVNTYTTAYGQYWPAISNVADVICGMPYPDHFAKNSYGIRKPWNEPYKLFINWGARAYARQQECPTPAIVRTWIQAYDVMRYVDRNGIKYNADNVEREIRGLYDAKLIGGYIPWNAASNIEKYKQQIGAYKIDYLKDWKRNNK